MIGMMVRIRSSFLARKSVRVKISANERPSSVVPAPVRTARNTELIATPQLYWVKRHPSPQISALKKRGKNSVRL